MLYYYAYQAWERVKEEHKKTKNTSSNTGRYVDLVFFSRTRI
jgi:hypothetical protein